jgi:hypothetical protein
MKRIAGFFALATVTLAVLLSSTRAPSVRAQEGPGETFEPRTEQVDPANIGRILEENESLRDWLERHEGNADASEQNLELIREVLGAIRAKRPKRIAGALQLP